MNANQLEIEDALEETLDAPCHGTATYEEGDAIYCSVCGALVVEFPLDPEIEEDEEDGDD